MELEKVNLLLFPDSYETKFFSQLNCACLLSYVHEKPKQHINQVNSPIN